MPLTRDFRESVMEDLRDPKFRRAFLREIVNELKGGDLDSAKSMLRLHVAGTVGFSLAGEALGISSADLEQQLSAEGAPKVSELLALTAFLERRTNEPSETVKQFGESMVRALNSISERKKSNCG